MDWRINYFIYLKKNKSKKKTKKQMKNIIKYLTIIK